MKLTFLGTGAADWPIEKPNNDREFRRLSSVVIDDILLIDPGPQVPAALQELGIDPQGIRYILNTHAHPDHFSAQTLAYFKEFGADFIPMHDREVITLGDYTIRAYKANHATCENTVHFLLSDKTRTLFYGLDGAWLLYEEYQAIKQFRPDFAVFDATIGDCPGDFRIFEHNNLNMVLELKLSLAPYIKQVCLSHLARTLHTDHHTLSKEMQKHQILVAYDGMVIDI